MSNFNNDEYQSLVTDLIGDAFYNETSKRGKISTIRQYTEVIVRKILDLPPDMYVTLGNKEIIKKIEELPNHEYIVKSLNIIRPQGNLATHTQKLENFTEGDFYRITDNLFNILAFPLINYFEKYEFGMRENVLYSFSMLPPIIRYKVLDYLYIKNPENIAVIDKLVLAMMKAFNVEEATNWVEKNKDKLTHMKTMTDEVFNKLIERDGIEIAELIRSAASPNMYELCKDKILKVGRVIAENGHLYSNFESALTFYLENGIIESNDIEIIEFNDIMNFLYLGRQKDLQKLPNVKNRYVVMNVFS